MNNKFEINEVVVVKNTGAQYSTYWDMYTAMKMDVDKRYVTHEGEMVKIFDMKPHDVLDETVIYGVVNKKGDEFLIGENGLDFLVQGRLKTVDVSISAEYTAIISEKCIKVGCQTISAAKLQEIIDAAKFIKLLK